MGTSLQVMPFASLLHKPKVNVPRALFNREKVGNSVEGSFFGAYIALLPSPSPPPSPWTTHSARLVLTLLHPQIPLWPQHYCKDCVTRSPSTRQATSETSSSLEIVTILSWPFVISWDGRYLVFFFVCVCVCLFERVSVYVSMSVSVSVPVSVYQRVRG